MGEIAILLYILVGIVIGVNAIFQTMQAGNHSPEIAHMFFGFAAAMWLFSLNYFLIAAHILLKSDNWKVFGLYSLFASIVSLIFMADTVYAAFIGLAPLWEMVYMWGMWSILWIQSFLAIFLGIKAVDKFSPHILIINGVASTFVPGALILLGIIL